MKIRKEYIYISIMIILLILNIIMADIVWNVNTQLRPGMPDRKEQLVYALIKRIYQKADFPLQDLNLISLDKKRFKLSSLVGKEAKLVFRFYETSCTSCVEKEINFLKKYFVTQENKVLILASYQHLRYLQILIEKYDLHFSVYNIEEEEKLDLFETQPYYFILDQDFCYKLYYEANNILPGMREYYYSVINKRIFIRDSV